SNFKTDVVTDHSWGLCVQPLEYAIARLKRKLVLKPNPAYRPSVEAGRLKHEGTCHWRTPAGGTLSGLFTVTSKVVVTFA
ncbi:MAG: hypothetical protein ACKPKO_62755, partial [Candidatus Fonsibacter sp.]